MILQSFNKIIERIFTRNNNEKGILQIKYPEFVPTIKEEDYNCIYYTLLNYNFDYEFIEEVYEEQFKYSEQVIKRFNLKQYFELICLNLNSGLNDIIDQDDFFRFLTYSSYYLTSEQAIDLTVKRLINEYFNVIIEFNNRILFFKENDEYFKRFKPWDDFFYYKFFVVEEVFKRLKISHSFCGSIHFKLNDLSSVINEYLLQYTLKAREDFNKFDDNRGLVLEEIQRVKLIYKKHKEFDFLKKYVNELNEIINDYNQGISTLNNFTQNNIKQVSSSQVRNTEVHNTRELNTYNFNLKNEFPESEDRLKTKLTKQSAFEVHLINFLGEYFSAQKKEDTDELLTCIVSGDINNLEKGSIISYATKIDSSRILFQLKDNDFFNENILKQIYKNEVVKVGKNYMDLEDFYKHNSRFYNDVKDKVDLITDEIDLKIFLE